MPHDHSAEGHGHAHSHSHSHGHGEEEGGHAHDMGVGLWVLGGIIAFLCVEKFVRCVKGSHGHSHGPPKVAAKEETNDKKDDKKGEKKKGDKKGDKKDAGDKCEEESGKENTYKFWTYVLLLNQNSNVVRVLELHNYQI